MLEHEPSVSRKRDVGELSGNLRRLTAVTDASDSWLPRKKCMRTVSPGLCACTATVSSSPDSMSVLSTAVITSPGFRPALGAVTVRGHLQHVKRCRGCHR